MREHSTRVRYRRLRFLGFPEYAVGTDGSVWSRWTRRGCTGRWRRIVPRAHHTTGRLQVALYSGEVKRKGRNFWVHHLVLLAFVGPRPPGAQCRHFPDPDYTNNRLDNLRWGTQSENEGDKVVHGTDNRGSRNGMARLNPGQVRKMRDLWATGRYTQRQLAAMFGLKGQGAVSLIVNRKSWRHLV